ncbi:histidine kinase dimerization/phospho-acceptor domain-containing protein [Desulfuromonas sp. TF]|uniref:histidine kinase dimerization/phospho-acceptor domain-containing protein n=1 Tax=Desulfuromonas sp. TF TaxID=1232410 RepID=UPI00040D7412|nr:GAF domain-containing sensor histidine kinase [Desulfuromonas sp. TF]
MKPDCCWYKENIVADECPFLGMGEEHLLQDRRQRFLRRCLECPRFRNDLRTLSDDHRGTLADLLPEALDELAAQRRQNHELNRQIEVRNRETRFLYEVGLVLQSSTEMDEVIAMALTAVTAGKGFGLNRAILMLVDSKRKLLRGYLAVGPRSREDAGRIWREIAERDYPLREMAQLFFREKLAAEREKFQDLLDKLSVPLDDHDHLFVQALNDQQSRHIPDIRCEPHLDSSRAEALGVRELILVPLKSKDRRVGLLLADNIVTGQPIAADDLHSLETFAMPVSFAIERASLYERLQSELKNLTEANRRLGEQQELILRMEKMALVGKLTASISHSIRNPMTIIGGFARTLNRNIPVDDPNRPYVESIMREARRLDGVLEEVLSYSESLHPTYDRWDINHLVTEVYSGLREDLETNDVNCRLVLAPDLPLVMVDFKKIVYCLRSIIRLALTDIPRGGEMEICTARKENELSIILSHGGKALHPETIRAVTSESFSEARQGGGLGLALCARILEDHGSDLEIRGREGAGTSFVIRLHIAKEESYGPSVGG